METVNLEDFVADVFTDRLSPTSEYSLNDSIPTNCSFGRGKRREEMPIPRMPNFLFSQLKENIPSVGRGIQRKTYTSQSTKPETVPVQSESDPDKNHPLSQEDMNSQNRGDLMEPLFIGQNCTLLMQSPVVPVEQPTVIDKKQTKACDLDMMDEHEFPTLTSGKKTTSKQTKPKKKKKKS